MVNAVPDDAKNEEERKQNSVQIIFKMPEAFMRRFDSTCEELGYTRTEAVREAMRRFQEENEKKLNQRPEVVLENTGRMLEQNYARIFEMAEKARANRTIVLGPSRKTLPTAKSDEQSEQR